MKLPIKKKYFDMIKAGEKFYEVRSAHITFICEETGETLRKRIVNVDIDEVIPFREEYPDIEWEGDHVVIFELEGV